MATIEELQAQLAALTARVDVITTPPETYYTMLYQGETIDAILTDLLPARAGGNGLPVNQGGTGASAPQSALNNLGGQPNRNLLDNWYFVGGGSQKGYGYFPINQNGKTAYAVQQVSPITIDRWNADWNLNLNLTDSGLTMSGGGIFQNLRNDVLALIQNEQITVSVLFQDGSLDTATGYADQSFSSGGISFNTQYGSGGPAVRIIGNVVAVKLELGDIQTLAYNDSSGAWHLLERPVYSQMLLRCLSRMIQFQPNAGIGIVQNSSTAYLTFPIPVPLDMSNGDPVLTVDISQPVWTSKGITSITQAALNDNHNGYTTVVLNVTGDFTGVEPGTVITSYLFSPHINTN